MDHCNLDHLNLKDLKSVCKYYKIDHASRVKRVELEALIYMAEHVQALTMIHIYNNAEAVPHSVLGGVLPFEHEGMQVMDIVPDTSNNSP